MGESQDITSRVNVQPAVVQVVDEPVAENTRSPGLPWFVTALLRRWRIFLSVCLLIGVPAVIAVTVLIKPEYIAVAQVSVAPRVEAILYEDAEKPIPMYDAYLNSQPSFATSHTVLTAALADPLLQDLPWVKQPDALSYMRSKLTVKTIPKTQIVQIEFKDDSADVAVRAARAVLKSYMARYESAFQDDRARKQRILEQTREDLQRRLTVISDEINNLASSFQTTSESTFEALRQLTEESIFKTRQELEQAELEVLEIEHQLKQLEAEGAGRMIPEDLLQAREAAVNNDAGVRFLMQELDAAIRRVAMLETALPAGDPKIIDAQQRVESLREKLNKQRELAAQEADHELQEKIKARVADRKARLEAELEVRRQKQRILQSRFEESKANSMAIGKQDLAIQKLREQKAGLKQELDLVQEKLRQLEIESRRENLGRISIASDAEIRPDGIEDKRRKAVPGAIAATLALAAGLALLRDFFDKQVRDTRQIESSMGLRLLGTIPSMKDVKNGLVTRDMLLESYRLIRTTLSGAVPGGDPPRSVLIASAQAGEGKTSLAVSLALSMAETGSRVLLIDGDVQRPQIGRILKLTPQFSLRDALVKRCCLPECAAHSTRGGFDVLVGRTNGQSARDVLNTASARELIRDARKHYDYVVVDSPPSLGAADALVWAQAVDSVILSMLIGHSEIGAVRMACQRLAGVGARLVGSVLGNVPVTQSYYSYSARSTSTEDDDFHARRESIVQLNLEDQPDAHAAADAG